MSGFRRHLSAIAVVTMSMQLAIVTLGSLRVCWGSEHRHAGAAAPECAMHHHSSAPAQEHGHHGQGSTNPPMEGAKVTCNCANDPGALYVGPSAVVVGRVSFAAPTAVDTVIRETGQSVPEIELTPLSPPPRTAFS
jgi:hypothetical protein